MSVATSLNVFLMATTLAYVLLLAYMLRGWLRIPVFGRSERPVSTKVSVVIAARNEAENIPRTLDCLIAQDFPRELMEIIVVDDHSTDETASVVASYADRGVKLIRLDESDKHNSYKKLAISRAIAQAAGEIIVTTDADCRMGKKWLATVIGFFEETDAFLVSSPVLYSEEKSRFERLQALEFLCLIGLGAAGIGNGRPTTCNGANLAYRKAVFLEMDGFVGIDNLASGDDELFLHKVAERYPDRVRFCKSRQAVVFTDAKPTLAAFISQRRRWASKSTKYKDRKVVALGLTVWLFNAAFLLGSVCFLAILPKLNAAFLSAFGLKMAAECLFALPLCHFSHRRDLLRYLPLLSLAHPLYLVYIGLAGNIGKYDWKGRKVR